MHALWGLESHQFQRLEAGLYFSRHKSVYMHGLNHHYHIGRCGYATSGISCWICEWPSIHLYISAGNGFHTILSVSCILCSFLEKIRLLTLKVTCSMEGLELDKQVRFIYKCFIAGYSASHVIGLVIYPYNR